MFIKGKRYEKSFGAMLVQFKQHIKQNFPELLHHQTLLAVSGGVDSMVLLHLFQMLKLDFAVAHCNFQLRDEESDLDEALVQKYCLENKIAFHLKRFDTVTYTNEQNVSIQRSEEHTSELQSRPHLVCRLLLEKKKKNI